jgi:hypothetical protein
MMTDVLKTSSSNSREFKRGACASGIIVGLLVASCGDNALSADADKGDSKSMEQKMIHAELTVKNCSAEIYLNDIPLKKLNGNEQSFISIPAHQFLVPGTNVLEIVVNPGGTPSSARIGGAELPVAGIVAEARVMRYAEGMFTGDPGGEKLAEAVWRPGAAATEQFPKLVRAQFDCGAGFGRWAWQDAQALDLKRDMPAISNLVQVVHEAFRTGQAGPVLERGSLRLIEGAKAYPARTLESIRKMQAGYFESNVQEEGWAVEPLDPAQADYRLCADGRMIEIVNKNWQPTIRSKPVKSGDVFPFPMFLSKIDGKFVIIR